VRRRWHEAAVGHKSALRSPPLTLPSLRDGPLPLPQAGEGLIAIGAYAIIREDV